ncbi:penicillin-binding protein activator [Herbaspirillum sp. RTI4]|uniref:penicillin-binding protein activator n=1 Tax=Herbaspirillum sp. RTI4 TaxID=3048640 RepID=UPI002AB54C2C|nr:penicillin-binding protein activator [Herbaspirillum sp. RTI4]MDY7577445.1 penicillin-binding protein activator [Herbaspirillum sp. RTI4]MEA9981721.1 penicillin-binding protein activator [Herbaspirillum sp. RTI4]
MLLKLRIALTLGTALLGGLSGLCAHAQANTTVVTDPAPIAAGPVRVALLLPLHSGVFGAAADAVRTGFLTAYEFDKQQITVNIVETGDTAQQMLTAYTAAIAANDIVVGPLSRSGVTAVAQSGQVSKPTIALTQPDLVSEVGIVLPQQLLLLGLSVEDEARQVAQWVEREKTPGKIFTLSTSLSWQRRAAKAFSQQAQRMGMQVESLEVTSAGNALNAGGLAQLQQRLQAEKPALIFAALDAAQAKQLRNAIGGEIPVYGTSQLNPLTLADQATAVAAPKADEISGVAAIADNPVSEKLADLNGVRFVDIPWQLQRDSVAVTTYPRRIVSAGEKHDADLERLYALGIDAYRVARQLAGRRYVFDLDGATGKLSIDMQHGATSMQRIETPGVYQDGLPVPLADQR